MLPSWHHTQWRFIKYILPFPNSENKMSWILHKSIITSVTSVWPCCSGRGTHWLCLLQQCRSQMLATSSATRVSKSENRMRPFQYDQTICKNGEDANIQVWSAKKMKVVSCYMLKPNVNDHVFFLIKPGPMERGYNLWILSASQLITMIQVIGALLMECFWKPPISADYICSSPSTPQSNISSHQHKAWCHSTYRYVS